MKKELLEKVSREYFEVREDGYVEFKYNNGVDFLLAFIREIVYKKMKKDFYSNPKIIFKREKFNDGNIDRTIVGNLVNKETKGFYQKPQNIIVINVASIIEDVYNTLKNHSWNVKDLDDNTILNYLIEMYLIRTLLHELVHSIEYNEYSNSNRDQYELENNKDGILRIVRKYRKLIYDYLGFSIYANIHFADREFNSVLLRLRELYPNDEDFELYWYIYVKEYLSKHKRYRKCSMIKHMFYHILKLNRDTGTAKQLSDITNKVFKDDYKIRIIFYENENLMRKNGSYIDFTKEDLTNPSKYAKKIASLCDKKSLYAYRYSSFKIIVGSNYDDDNKIAYIHYAIDPCNIKAAIQM